MKTPRPNDKLEEARFFLRHLQEEDRKAAINRPDAFKYYLSAFLSAAISVLYILFKTEDTFQAWYRTWRENLSQGDREFLNRMWERRGSEVHSLGMAALGMKKAVPAELEPGFEIFGPPQFFYGEANVHAVMVAGVPLWSRAWVYIPRWYFEDKDEVLQACERFIALLERLLRDFESSDKL